jgi:hypothetical protein
MTTFNNKESYHSIEKVILYNINYIFISNILNLANYFKKNAESTVDYKDLVFFDRNDRI